jgi:hypothetical protein
MEARPKAKKGSIFLGIALNPVVPIHDHGVYSGAVAKGIALAAMARGLRIMAKASAGQ